MWQFNRSKRYLDIVAYRQAFKQHVCGLAKEPVKPSTLTNKEAEKIRAMVKRLYAKS